MPKSKPEYANEMPPESSFIAESFSLFSSTRKLICKLNNTFQFILIEVSQKLVPLLLLLLRPPTRAIYSITLINCQYVTLSGSSF